MGNCLGTNSSPHIIWGCIPGKFPGKIYLSIHIGYQYIVENVQALFWRERRRKIEKTRKEENKTSAINLKDIRTYLCLPPTVRVNWQRISTWSLLNCSVILCLFWSTCNTRKRMLSSKKIWPALVISV